MIVSAFQFVKPGALHNLETRFSLRMYLYLVTWKHKFPIYCNLRIAKSRRSQFEACGLEPCRGKKDQNRQLDRYYTDGSTGRSNPKMRLVLGCLGSGSACGVPGCEWAKLRWKTSWALTVKAN